jgi:AraC family transcriptional regulator
MNQIPDKILQEDEKYLGSDVALFRPKSYVTDKIIQSVDFHIFLLTSAPPDIYIDGKMCQYERGRIFTINPGNRVLCKNSPPAKPFFSLLIKPDLIERVAQEMGISPNIRFLELQNPYSRELMQAIRNFDRESKRPDPLNLMLDSLAMQITILLLREFKTNSLKQGVHLPDSLAYINLAIEYMHAYFSSKIRLDDMCKEIHVSHFHFIRTFKQNVGVSPHQYLLNVRIQKAEELLREKQYSVAEVAILCGFISSSHFSNTFKSIKGYSPSEYKKLVL